MEFWLAVDENGDQFMYSNKPERDYSTWTTDDTYLYLYTIVIKELIGRNLTWSDEPVKIEIKEVKE